MTTEFLKNKIENECHYHDIIVLKGFAPDLIEELGRVYPLLDDYVIENGKIILENVNENRLMISILSSDSSRKSICTIESFIKMCTQITGLSVLGKNICVLDNNMMELYPNPSNADIPDFDSKDFEDTENETSLYSAFYSFCINEDGIQRVQYIDNYSDSNTCVEVKELINPVPFVPVSTISDHADVQIISTKDGSLYRELESLYRTMTISSTEFAVEAEEIDEKGIRAFVEAAKLFGCPVHMHKLSRNINVEPRKELYDYLKKVWGYESFRQLKMYNDLSVNHDVVEISQGSIIETVVQQAEYAYHGDTQKVSNVLLTSPTGAGKSLLFQLAAIYLAEKYGLLTIIVSPLVALMNDQVEGLTGYDAVATLNSNKTAAEKESILEGVLNGKINLLYLSPELLLSYTIKSFIGERKLGLLVVDEAHTVTTWGRDFRVDYWFLGDYLRKSKRILKYPFPIFALTATAVWDPSGKNDMIFDTIRSLNMDPCIKYVGVVRRSNIVFEIEKSNITTGYEDRRRRLTVQRMKEALAAKRKAIVYFPFRRTVDAIYLSDDITDIRDKVTRYHAALYPDEKVVNAEAFRTGQSPIMCATKAFGMGIDVSDINEVYHHAPTGCLSDYVQEIGRLARDPQITGIAIIDFSEKDFKYIRQLHGLSAIRPYQLIQVLKKLMAIYRINGEKRNMLISASDFSYIFPMSSPDDIDQNLKSCLLLISNDLLNKLRFQSLIVRPKSLFSKCYVEVPRSEATSFHRAYKAYLRSINNTVFVFDADKYWTEKYSSISFPMFKMKLATGKIFKSYNVELKNKVILTLHDTVENVLDDVEAFFTQAHRFLAEMANTGHRLGIDKIKSELPSSYDNLKKEQFIETFRLLYATDHGLDGDTVVYCKTYKTSDGKESFQLTQSGYETTRNRYRTAYEKEITNQEVCVYCSTKDPIVKVSEFLNSLGVADYHRQGGDQPAIFVRINNPYYLNSLIKSGRYRNGILESIYDKYEYSEKIFTYFFTTKMTNEQRWDFIEAYFLGASESELLNFVKA